MEIVLYDVFLNLIEISTLFVYGDLVTFYIRNSCLLALPRLWYNIATIYHMWMLRNKSYIALRTRKAVNYNILN